MNQAFSLFYSLGSEMTYPTLGYGLRLKINPFAIEMK
jgi:hypothetical protein